MLTVKMATKADATTMYSLAEQWIEVSMNIGRDEAARLADEWGNGFGAPPLVFEFMKGSLRTMLPDVEEDKLVFRAKGTQGFSKIWTLSTVAGLLQPAIQQARFAVRKMSCTDKIRQIVIAIHVYHDVHDAFPPLYTVDKDGKPLHSWRVLLLPFLEQTALYDAIRHDEPWDSEHNKQFHDMILDVYRCPNNPNVAGKANCHYSVIAGEGFRPAVDATTRHWNNFAHITDGTSNTLAIIEVKEPFCWMDPTADVTLEQLLKGINAEGGRAGSTHPGGCNIGLFDASVRFLPLTIDTETLQNLAKPNSGKAITLPR
jgi:hypothetical protein